MKTIVVFVSSICKYLKVNGCRPYELQRERKVEREEREGAGKERENMVVSVGVYVSRM